MDDLEKELFKPEVLLDMGEHNCESICATYTHGVNC